MKSKTKGDVALFGLRSLLLLVSLGLLVGASAKISAKDARTLRLSDSETAVVTISGRGTVLNFPVKPSKVILGKANSFGIEYCDTDLAISPLSPTAHSHLYVYLYGRRFSFDLVAAMDSGEAIVLVRDAKDRQTEVKYHE